MTEEEFHRMLGYVKSSQSDRGHLSDIEAKTLAALSDPETILHKLYHEGLSSSDPAESFAAAIVMLCNGQERLLELTLKKLRGLPFTPEEEHIVYIMNIASFFTCVIEAYQESQK